MKKKLVALGLSLIMALGLFACGGGDTSKESVTSEKPAFVYVPEYFDWEIEASENGYINTYGAVNGYVLGMKRDYNYEAGTSSQTIIKYNIAEGTTEQIPYVSEDPNEYLNTFTLNSAGNIVACAEVYSWDEVTQIGASSYRILELDSAGQVVNTVDLTSVYEEIAKKNDYAYINNIAMDGEGTIYVVFEQEIVALNTDGSKMFSVETSNWIQSMGNMSDGSVYAVYYGNEGSELSILDKAAKGFGTTYKLGSYNINGFFNISEDNNLYFSDGNSVYKMNLATSETEELFQWLAVDMNGQYIEGVNYIDENTIFGRYRDWSNNEEGFIKVVKTDSSLVQLKETITMVSLYNHQDIQEDIVAFNKSNDKYRIEYKIYLDYNKMSESDWENIDQFRKDAETRMINDLTGNNPPDIISVSNSSISAKTLADKGLLEELTPYLEQAGYSESDFVEGVVNSYKVDSKLYSMPERFYIQTMLADSAYVGDEKGWTLQEALEVIKNLPEGVSFSEGETQQYFIQKCLMYGYKTFIDEKNATCNFDSDEFKAILEMAKTFPKEYEWNEDTPSTPVLVSSGEVLTIEQGITSLEDIQVALAYFGDKTPTFIGYPGVGGNGALFSAYGGEYVICSKSEYKDVLADFVIEKITAPYDPEDWSSWGFPTLKSELDAQIQDEITIDYLLDEDGNPVLDEEGNPIPMNGGGSMSWGDWEYEYRPCNQEDADIFMDLVSGVEGVFVDSNTTLFTMIMEEVEPFLNGQKTADEVAAVIQNRISLYLIENS